MWAVVHEQLCPPDENQLVVVGIDNNGVELRRRRLVVSRAELHANRWRRLSRETEGQSSRPGDSRAANWLIAAKVPLSDQPAARAVEKSAIKIDWQQRGAIVGPRLVVCSCVPGAWLPVRTREAP